MPDGGTITFRTENAAEGFRVGISDSGKGMTPEEMEHAFEPFFTTKGEQGAGLDH